jgi:hypothetical protein
MRQAFGLRLENGHVPGALPRAGMSQAVGLKPIGARPNELQALLSVSFVFLL